MMPARKTASGFTLVELLLAVTLMSLLLALAYGGFRAATRASFSGQELIEESGRLRITHQFVRRQLNQMLPLTFEIELGESNVAARFVGDSRKIQYVAPMPGYLGQGGPQVQVMEIVDTDKGLGLHFSHALLQEFLPERLFDRPPIVLLDNIEYAKFEFLGRDENGEIITWAPYWDDPSIMPIGVRLDLDFAEDSKVFWPQLVANVRLDEEAIRESGEVKDYREAIRDMIRNRKDREE